MRVTNKGVVLCIYPKGGQQAHVRTDLLERDHVASIGKDAKFCHTLEDPEITPMKGW